MYGIPAVLLAFFASSGPGAPDRVDVYPGMDIATVVQRKPAGTTFVIHTGIYRMQRIEPKEGDTFEGEPGAVLNGSKLLTSFQQSNGFYYATGLTHVNYAGVGPVHCQADYPACTYPEDLYFDDKPLLRVLTAADVGPGSWYFDFPKGTIYFRDSPDGHKVEISQTATAFERWNGGMGSKANRVTIRGLTVEKYATPGLTGAIGGVSTDFGFPDMGANWVVENNEVRLNHGAGIRVNFGWRVRHNRIHNNGNFGISAGVGGGNADGSGSLPSDIVIDNNELAYNNYAHVKPQFGAGGAKLLRTRGLIFRGNYSHDNGGVGLWTDTNNYDTLYDDNVIADNADEGAFHEISYSAVIRNNKLLRNGYIHSSGKDWLYAANLLSSSSQGVEAYCNTVEVSGKGGNGIDILGQNRGSAYVSVNNYFHHNAVFFDADSGITGGATDDRTQQTFFKLNRFDYNSYHLPNLGRRAFAWGNKFNTFSQFQAAGQESHGTADTKTWHDIPSVVITSPIDGSRVSGSVSVTGNAQSHSSIRKAELYVDWSLQSSEPQDSFAFHWNTNAATAGPHTLAVMVYDAQGIRACYAVTSIVR